MALSLIFAIKMLSTILYKELTSIDSVIGSAIELQAAALVFASCKFDP